MRERTIKVYSVTELSDRARERAFDNWLQVFDYPWGSENSSTLKAFSDIFPVRVHDWSYDAYTHSVSFDMECVEEAIINLSGVRLATYIWNNYGSDLFRGKYYSNGRKHRRSRIIMDTSCVLTGYYLDEDILAPVYTFLRRPDGRSFRDLMEDCLDAWGKACSADYEDQTSERVFIEDCEANEWEFDEDGRMA